MCPLCKERIDILNFERYTRTFGTMDYEPRFANTDAEFQINEDNESGQEDYYCPKCDRFVTGDYSTATQILRGDEEQEPQ